MRLRFSKMHCLGDDLMLVELLSQHARVQSQHMRRWSSRTHGVGFKRLLLIDVPRQPDVDFDCRVFDQNGVELDCNLADLCCAARLLSEKRLTHQPALMFGTRGAHLQAIVHDDGRVSVSYPLSACPAEQPESAAEEQTKADVVSRRLLPEQQQVQLSAVVTRVYEGYIKI